MYGGHPLHDCAIRGGAGSAVVSQRTGSGAVSKIPETRCPARIGVASAVSGLVVLGRPVVRSCHGLNRVRHGCAPGCPANLRIGKDPSNYLEGALVTSGSTRRRIVAMSAVILTGALALS